MVVPFLPVMVMMSSYLQTGVAPVFRTLKGVGRVTVARPTAPSPSLHPPLLLPAPECQPAAPASSSAVRVVAARPRVSTKAHFYEAGQWRFRGCRAARGAPGQGRAGRVRSALPAPLQLCIWTRGWDRDSRMVQFPPAPPYQRTTTTPAMPSGRRGRLGGWENFGTQTGRLNLQLTHRYSN